jgi:hypothetical protein
MEASNGDFNSRLSFRNFTDLDSKCTKFMKNSKCVSYLKRWNLKVVCLMIKSGIIGVSILAPAFSLENGLAKKPPMGWLSWQRYGCQVDAKLIRETADAMVAKRPGFSKSLKDVGYVYVNIDDCWSLKERSATGDLVPDPVKFPKHEDEVPDDDGMKSVSKYLHDQGLFFGLYADIGSGTCQQFPGFGVKLEDGRIELRHMEKDVAKFVEWEIDALKVDGCNAPISQMRELYSALSDEMMAQTEGKRRILYSCSWPAYQRDHCENKEDMQTLIEKCNLWRNYGDIEDSVCHISY